MTMDEAILILQSLKLQLHAAHVPDSEEYDEISLSNTSMALKRDGKVLRVPLVQAALLDAIQS